PLLHCGHHVCLFRAPLRWCAGPFRRPGSLALAQACVTSPPSGVRPRARVAVCRPPAQQSSTRLPPSSDDASRRPFRGRRAGAEHMITDLEFKSLPQQGYTRIPLMATAFADLDAPLSLYLKLAHGRGDGQHSFLLESVVGGERFG